MADESHRPSTYATRITHHAGCGSMAQVRTGVYICHCGVNIAGIVDVVTLAEFATTLEGVVIARHHEHLCSSAGQEAIKQDIRGLGLDRVVVAACSPHMHELTFRKVLDEAGLNPYLLAIANIREHCSWIIADTFVGTEKAKRLIRAGVARVAWQEPLQEREAEVYPACLVVGGGVAGIQAALSVARAGYHVYLVEKEAAIGGHMAQLDRTFPTLECSACILTPRMVAVERESNIDLLTCSEVVRVTGHVGDFKVRVRKKPRYVDLEECTGCGECVAQCPIEMADPFERGLVNRKAIYQLFPQAVPRAFAVQKEGIAPCRAACPAGVNVPGYLALIGQDKFQEALDLIRRDNPFPGVCGRVCHHPCEGECRRAEVDEPLAIRALKRFVADWQMADRGWQIADAPMLLSAIGHQPSASVAIIGSGPTGLTAAYHLAKRAYGVTVFEALPVAGGMMAVGIPEYRLPKRVLAAEIAHIRSLGVEILTNTPIAKDIGVQDLFERGYRAIFLAVGAHKSEALGIPGEELKGVLQGVVFLRELNLGRRDPDWVMDRVVVVGGGNTAVDAARAALRLGAAEVTIVYRRSREEMPAIPSQIEEAEREGVRIQPFAVPTRIVAENGRVRGVEFIRLGLGEAHGEDSQFTLPADNVIVAVGQSPELAFLGGVLEITGEGTIAVDPHTLATSQPGVFAGGDAATGPATVIEAIAAGKRAAESIDRYLREEDLKEGRIFGVAPQEIVRKEIAGVERANRQLMSTLSPQERVSSFREVERGFTQEMTLEEAKRCLNCPGCVECLQCEAVCTPQAIRHEMGEEYLDLEVGAIILATGHEFFNPTPLWQYSYGLSPNVIDSMEFERMCNPAGPTGGNILLADGRAPGSVAFLHCVGCRDVNARIYCSRLCCMHAMKQAHLVRERTGAQVYEFYTDIRAGGKGYEEFYEQVQREGVIFIRGRGAEVVPVDGKLVVRAEDTNLGRPINLAVDMVVLVTGLVPRSDASQVAQTFHITHDKDGFFLEAHPKLRPFSTNTEGIFLAGTCHGPKDIPDSIAHANAAAAEALALLGPGRVTIEPIVAEIDPHLCTGCKICLSLCPYSALTFDAEKDIVEVNSALCRGCGTCVAACPSDAATARHFTEQQILAQIEALLVQ